MVIAINLFKIMLIINLIFFKFFLIYSNSLLIILIYSN